MATNIIDPNDAIASESLTNLGLNATPDYSDMFIFAELTARRRNASILVTDGVGKKITASDAYDSVSINMMGFDKDSGKYTTKWTNSIGDNSNIYEGFGITKIDITVNSSFVPQIDIEFIDIRGLSLISLGTKSKYSVIYSFPPPIFTLTVKGYYGKAISYDLHLVSQSTKFDATSGNYFINAKFVGSRYGSLTDILFKYVDIVPLIDDSINVNDENNSAVNFKENEVPKNTRELITRSKKLYDDIEKIKVDSKESIELDGIRNEIVEIETLLSSMTIASILTQTPPELANIGYYINESNSGIMVYTTNNIRKVENLNEYDSIIKALSPNEVKNLDKRLCLLYEYSELVNGTENNITLIPALKVPNLKYSNITSAFKSIKDKFIKSMKLIDSRIANESIVLINENDIATSNGKKYIGIDISSFYTELKQLHNKKTDSYNQVNNVLRENINKLAIKNLGFMPSIRNIFTIILNDVDDFNNKLRETCKNAEISHNDKLNFSEIIQTTTQKIAPFPLVVKKENRNGKDVEQRAYPGDPSLSFSKMNFPEVDFVESFINAFIKVIKSDQINNLKTSIDADGNYKWIPANPLDSDTAIENGNYSTESPYKNKFNINDLSKEILNRFYIASQYSYGFLFYEIDGETMKEIFEFFGASLNTKNDSLLDYIAKSEASNLVNSIMDLNLLDSVTLHSKNWASSEGVNLFYDMLDNLNKTDSSLHYTGFDDQIDPLYTTTNYLKLGDINISKNRLSNKYVGFEILTKTPTLRSKNSTDGNGLNGETNYVDKFIEDVGETGFFKNIIFDNHGFDDFTKQNVPYIKDKKSYEDKLNSDFNHKSSSSSTVAITSGYNTYSNTNTSTNATSSLNILENIAQSLANIGSDKIISLLNDTQITNEMKAYFIVGGGLLNSLSYYDKKNDINKKFTYPSIIEIPLFAHLNMGALAYFFYFDYANDPVIKPKIDYFVKTYGFKSLYYPNNTLIKNLSEKDARNLVEKDFNAFVNIYTGKGGFSDLKDSIIKLINDVKSLNITSGPKIIEQYKKRLSGDCDPLDKATSIIETINKKIYLLNYSQSTFSLDHENTLSGNLPTNTFTPLKEINQNTDKKLKKINDRYFSSFFKNVVELCEQKRNEIKKIETNFRQTIGDNDIKNQMYYSFKSIADKWIIGLEKSTDKKLVEDFMFVDRFFNDIGDNVMIDIRPLIELSQDYDVSVYGVLSKILSLNGFEFFPLQNFINFEHGDEWKDTFKTYGTSKYLAKNQTPQYICMYIGGTSSQLSDISSGYKDDGYTNASDLEASPDYNRDKVKGFKVNFAKQNQSMFTNIQLDTNEHKETNESLAILSELANDQSASSPVPKGQNLYTTYEQRSYSCTVEALGNALIQPTQYFVLENVPMFNGAYLILEVKHSIIPNSMRTSFMGVRIKKATNPLVSDFATSIGMESGGVGSTTIPGTSSSNNGSTESINTMIFDPAPIKDMNNILVSP